MGVLAMVCCRPLTIIEFVRGEYQPRNLSASRLLAAEPTKQEPPLFGRGLCETRLQCPTVRGISSHGRASYGLGEYWSQKRDQASTVALVSITVVRDLLFLIAITIRACLLLLR